MTMVKARAHPNIALVKYWGKRDASLNLPFADSISLTLSPFVTETSLRFSAALKEDVWTVNGERLGPMRAAPLSAFLDLFRQRAGTAMRAEGHSSNSFPTAAGLASSSSAFAALSLAADAALGLHLSRQELSAMARRGSGSATRSLHGGYVEWRAGSDPLGRDSFAIPLAPASHWPLSVLVAVVDDAPKSISSREAMARAVATSGMFPAWIEIARRDCDPVRDAIRHRSLDRLGPLIERNCLAMCATQWTSDPPVMYWKPATIAILGEVERMRTRGIRAYFTMDAGPNVKVLVEADDREAAAECLSRVPGVKRVIEGSIGGPACLIHP